ncbi:hypothetical protein F5Y02DRAFT_426408 [Annulohypoxylon stygium]|nr:hypothetical protein F5Y02DRAFT_426408 [Annulohypoxylon stygium]
MMDEPETKYWHSPIPETGLTVLVEPNKPSLDIVFIHGFNGHPERTWTCKKGSHKNYSNNNHVTNDSAEPPHKIRKLNPFSSSYPTEDSVPTNYWPRDLIPITAPDARILTYGYDTHVRHWAGSPVSQNTVYDIAWNLLVALESERRTEPLRPVLFVAHSLGGIVIKEMLRRSKGHMGQVHLRDIFESTVGIMFFGTPHAGADPRGFLQRVAEKAIRAAGFSVNEQIVNTLLPSSERLQELRDEFGPMAKENNWVVHSFQEQIGVKILNYRKVVEDTSSCLNFPAIEIKEHIGRDHMEMCRFAGFDDIEYKKVAAALRRMIASVSGQSSRSTRPSLGKEQKRELLNSLKFDQIDARHMTIKNAHSKTCKWLLKKSEYREWLDRDKLNEHHGFLWVKGKPGAGKSTLMKFILANSRKSMRGKIIISFFFNARGDYLEKSTTGMYRSLLLQLLQQLPELQDVFSSLGLATWSSGCHHWSVEALKELFEQAVQGLGRYSLVCFIDALDECDEHQIRDMISFFEHVGELTTQGNISFQVCFSSRHYPYITIRKGLSLILEGQDGHSQDIVNYLESELQIGHSNLAEQIRDDLKEKAAGVFMWVILVVQILNKEYDGGRIHRLRKRLQDIPGDLHELFRDILTRDRDNSAEMLLCIQWVLFAKQPMKPEQLYFAVLSGIEPGVLSVWDCDEITIADIERFLLNASKGLAETTKSETPTVQFIHESVRDFLGKIEWREIWPDLGKNLDAQSHERLKKCCLDYMRINISAYVKLDNALPKASCQEAAVLRQSVNEAFPFLEYAVRNALYHADTAEGCGVSQARFLQTFQVTDWIKLDNLLEIKNIRRHTPNASLLYILAEHNMGNLIKIHPSKQACSKIEDERHGPPILAALATGSGEAVRVFLQAQVEAAPPTSPLHGLYEQYCQDENKQFKLGRNFTFSRQKGILNHLCKEVNETLIIFFLLSIDNLDLNQRDSYEGRTPLSWAASNGQKITMKLLLEKGADIESKDNREEATIRLLLENGAKTESKDNEGLTPLAQAAKKDHKALVKLLLEEGADVNSKDDYGKSVLSIASRLDSSIAQLLLDNGADMESKDNQGRTPLSHAVEHSDNCTKLLLEKGADHDTKDIDGRTLLSWAAEYSYNNTKLLLEKGADIESKDNNGRTPLSWAAGKWGKEIAELLLEKGADTESKDNNGRTPLLWAAEKLGQKNYRVATRKRC